MNTNKAPVFDDTLYLIFPQDPSYTLCLMIRCILSSNRIRDTRRVLMIYCILSSNRIRLTRRV